jgi:hypothetical protein
MRICTLMVIGLVLAVKVPEAYAFQIFVRAALRPSFDCVHERMAVEAHACVDEAMGGELVINE